MGPATMTEVACASPGKIRADFISGKISVDELMLHVEPLLNEAASDGLRRWRPGDRE